MSSSEQVNVIASIDVKPEFLEEFIKFLKSLVEESRKEKGLLVYELNQDISNSSKLIIYEEYTSNAAFEYHKSTKHFLDFVKFAEGKTNSISLTTMKKLI